MSKTTKIDRRWTKREFRAALHYGNTWFGALQKRGVIPPGHVDPGGRRQWWSESEVRATLRKLKRDAQAPSGTRPGHVEASLT